MATDWITRVLPLGFALLPMAAFGVVESGIAPAIFRGSLDPGFQAFWLVLLLSGMGLAIVLGEQRPAERVSVRRMEPSKPASGGSDPRTKAA